MNVIKLPVRHCNRKLSVHEDGSQQNQCQAEAGNEDAAADEMKRLDDLSPAAAASDAETVCLCCISGESPFSSAIHCQLST